MMNISGPGRVSPSRPQSSDLDTEDQDHLQDVLSNASLHITDGRHSGHPYVAKFGAALAVLQILLMLGVVGVCFALPYILGANVDKYLPFDVYTLLVYILTILCIIFFLIDLLYSAHHRRLKMKGYLRFYRSIKFLQRYPFCVSSLFLTLVLALTNLLTYHCKPFSDKCVLWTLTPVMWLQIITSTQTALLIVGLFVYLSRVYYQNKNSLTPDDAENQMLTSFQPHNLDTSLGVGYRADSYVDDIIEHQADRIRSLQDQNSVLSKKLYALSSKHSTLTSRH